MISLYDELSGKMNRDPSLLRRSGPRVDLGILLFAEREGINELWKTADRCARLGDSPERIELRGAVEKLRRLFGERVSRIEKY
jgi:hypothetical protein